jgi:hypothetical protein
MYIRVHVFFRYIGVRQLKILRTTYYLLWIIPVIVHETVLEVI